MPGYLWWMLLAGGAVADAYVWVAGRRRGLRSHRAGYPDEDQPPAVPL